MACLKCARDHLQDNGVFILDLYPGEASEEDGSETTSHEENDGKTVIYTATYSNDLTSQLRSWKFLYEVTHPNGEVERKESQAITALITPREGNFLLKQAGLQIVEEYGGWDFTPYELDSSRRVLVLQKEDD